jgi:hypothetical protein
MSTPMMFCCRCEQVYETTKLVCVSCRNVMVGAAVNPEGEVVLVRLSRPCSTHLPMPGMKLDPGTPVR